MINVNDMNGTIDENTNTMNEVVGNTGESRYSKNSGNIMNTMDEVVVNIGESRNSKNSGNIMNGIVTDRPKEGSQPFTNPIKKSSQNKIIADLPPIIDMGDITDINPKTNNWNEKNENTLRTWKISLTEYLHIYQFVLDSAQIKMNRCLFIVEVLGVFASLLSIISASALGFSKLKVNSTTTLSDVTSNDQIIFSSADIISLIIAVFVAIINLLITLLNRLIKIYKWDSTIAECAAYISNMDQIYSTIAVELSLPVNSRNDANKFIRDISVKYLDLIKNSPNIDLDDQKEAMKQYEQFIEGKIKNFHLTQKYAKNDNNISVI